MSEFSEPRERRTGRSHLPKVRSRSLIAGGAVGITLILAAGVAGATVGGVPLNPFGTSRTGQQADGRILLPNNRWISPAGRQLKVGGEVAGTAISPDGTKLAVASGGPTAPSLYIEDAATGATLQSFRYPADAVSAPVYAPDGTALYVPQRAGILRYVVGPDGTISNPTSPSTITLPGGALPSGLILSADGSTLYAALNGLNTLAVVDTASGTLTKQVAVGNAPWDVAVVGGEAFVSNRGGRPAQPDDTTTLADTTRIVADPVTGASSTGTVSVIDLGSDTVSDTVKVGLQPTDLAVHDGAVFVTNTGSDTVSVIETKGASHQVTQTFNVEPLPGSTVGADPNALAFADSQHFLVSVGGDNAIAVYGYAAPHEPVRYEGLIPTGWDPSQVQYDASLGQVIVSNGKGVGEPAGVRSTASYTGTVNSLALPGGADLASLTKQVFADNAWDTLPLSNTPAPPGQAREASSGSLPAVPARLGMPSAIKHVFIIDKENHAYDQDLGDIGKGDSDPSLASYGATVTPNEHSLANTFSLFDNFYDPSWRSTGGHEWVAQADENDMLLADELEGQPHLATAPAGTGGGANGFSAAWDSLYWQSSGFIWDDAQGAGRTVRDYGEFVTGNTGTVGTWPQYYADSQIMEGKATGDLPIAEDSALWNSIQPSANKISDPLYPTFDLGIPDQYRVDVWEQEFRQAEKTGKLADLNLIALGNDHTGGPTTAQAAVADNDLALGRIVDEISHSRFWKSSAIFVVEDDSSMSVDHLSGHRAPVFVASPYAKRGVVNSSYYSQINVVKTAEQILGMQPMNQMDRAAVPMFDAFTDKPDFTPYTAQPNQVPLTQGVTGLIPLTPAASDSAKTAATLTATSGPPAPAVPAAERAVAAQWATWLKTEAQPTLTGPHAAPDSVNPAQMNRYDWYTSTNWSKPFPGDWAILAPDQVPGRNVASDLSGD